MASSIHFSYADQDKKSEVKLLQIGSFGREFMKEALSYSSSTENRQVPRCHTNKPSNELRKTDPSRWLWVIIHHKTTPLNPQRFHSNPWIIKNCHTTAAKL